MRKVQQRRQKCREHHSPSRLGPLGGKQQPQGGPDDREVRKTDCEPQKAQRHEASRFQNRDMEQAQPRRRKQVIERRLKHLESLAGEGQRAMLLDVADVVHVSLHVETDQGGQRGKVIREQGHPASRHHCERKNLARPIPPPGLRVGPREAGIRAREEAAVAQQPTTGCRQQHESQERGPAPTQ